MSGAQKNRWPHEGDVIRLRVDEPLLAALDALSRIYPRMTAKDLIRQTLFMRADRLVYDQCRFEGGSIRLNEARRVMPPAIAMALEEAAR